MSGNNAVRCTRGECVAGKIITALPFPFHVAAVKPQPDQPRFGETFISYHIPMAGNCTLRCVLLFDEASTLGGV